MFKINLINSLLIIFIEYYVIVNCDNIVSKSKNDDHSNSNKNLTCDDISILSSSSSLLSKHHNYKQKNNNYNSYDKNKWIIQNNNDKLKTFMNEGYLRGSSILFGLTQFANEQHLTDQCYNQLKEIEKAVLRKDIWAMKVLDSSGGKESGFLWGHNYWLGSKEGCEAVQNPVYITLSDQYKRAMKMGLINDLAPFQMQYRVIYVKHNSPWQVEIKFMTEAERIIHIGLCLPEICSTSEIYNMTQTFLEQGFFEEGNMYDLHAKVIHIKDLKLNKNFINKISVKLIGIFLIFTIFMILCASCTDIFNENHSNKIMITNNHNNNNNNNNKINDCNKIDKNINKLSINWNEINKKNLNDERISSIPVSKSIIKSNELNSFNSSNILSSSSSSTVTEIKLIKNSINIGSNSRDPLTWYPHPIPHINEKLFLYKFIKCFDIIENCRKLFACNELNSTSIPAINGLRSISCIWILLFHVIWYMYFTVDNRTFLISYGERASFQYISTAPLLVDVFFTISGFLSAYNFIRNEKNLMIIRNNKFQQNAKMFGKLILHRYLRLAPSYLVLIGFVEIFTAYTEDVSLFHIHERYDQTCSKYWWRNILFIQNLFHQDELCLNWTWSLACEMQFYIVSLILLFFYAKHPEKAKIIFIIKFFSTIAWTLIAGYRFQYGFSFDVVYNTGTEIYINPFIRIMPYFIGIGSGWFMAITKGNFNINDKIEKSLWNTAIILFFSCIYSLIKRDLSFFSAVSLLIIGRLTFSFAVIWMIIGSATGRGVWWSRFLEWKFFQHLNKLSYSIYLLNPFIIAIVFSLSNTSTHADPLLLGVLTIGFIVIVYICSIVFSLLFEIPYCNLSLIILRKKN